MARNVVYFKGKKSPNQGIAIPVLDFSTLPSREDAGILLGRNNDIFADEPSALPTVKQQFKTHAEKLESLDKQHEETILDPCDEKILFFFINAKEAAESGLGLMQAITGNEHDSYVEKVRKARIPGRIRSAYLTVTKNCQDEYAKLYSEFGNALENAKGPDEPLDKRSNSDSDELPEDLEPQEKTKTSAYDIYREYGNKFFTLADYFYKRAEIMQKYSGYTILSPQASPTR